MNSKPRRLLPGQFPVFHDAISDLTPEERSDDLTPLERFACRPYSMARPAPGRCYFFLEAKPDETDQCIFPWARNWASNEAKRKAGRGRHAPIKIEDLESCPLLHIGSAHLGEVLAPYRYIQRGPYRVPVFNGKILWDEAAQV